MDKYSDLYKVLVYICLTSSSIPAMTMNMIFILGTMADVAANSTKSTTRTSNNSPTQ